MIKVTDQHKWERAKNATAYTGWLSCIIYYSYQYGQGMAAPKIDIPMIIMILSLARLMKILIKEG